ncbi:MAG: outer membrane protein assembly factor BamA [Hyphomicrobiaceae bacterium]|nr:outer membrane protein assembly factor BamA [Hyphomicrobiaceae bacterium]MCC0023484.1 outer membrane protein assembly factor BamA [Hyphomicrobiaceae bacterium]
MTFANSVRAGLLAIALTVIMPLTGLLPQVFGVENAMAQRVAVISVTGNQRVDDATVKSYLTIRVGDVATNDAIQSSIASLNATGLFSTVSVRYSSGTLAVGVRENQVVSSVLFEGNKRFTDDDLIRMVNLASSGTYTDERLAADKRTIELAYSDAGYTGVTVTPRTEVTDDNRIRVVFAINEGDRAGVAAINFTGNTAISGWVLKDVITTKETNLLSWLFLDDEYSEDKLEADKAAIKRYYADHGYPDARVLSAVADYDASKNAYYVNFTIDEGEHYTFGDVSIETSLPGLNADALRGNIQTYSGAGYSQADLEKSVADIGYRATGQGYPFAEVRPRLERDVATHTFRVTYLVDEGAHVYVERIDIIGNTKTRDFVIRRELDFGEGDPFNRALLTRGKAKIEALGYFSSVVMTTSRGSAADKVVLTIAVDETSSGSYGATAGWDSNAGLLGELSLTERNFLGRGQYLKISVGASLDPTSLGSNQTYGFSFTEPRFMGSKVSAGIDVSRAITDESSSAFYGSDVISGQIRIGIPLTDELTLTPFFGLQQSTYADLIAPTSALVTNGQVLAKGTVGYKLNFTKVDDVAMPRNGFVAELTQSYAFLDHNFLSTEARARYLVEVVPDSGVVLSVRGQAGYLYDFSGAGVHPTETFKPGQRLVRGFAAGGLGPRGPLVAGATNGETYGTTAYAGVSAELEFPIPMLPESYGLRGAIWADAGWVGGASAASPVPVSGISTSLRTSAGASLLWNSPFGPLRGDYAFYINGATGDIPQRFQFTISTLL